MTGKINRVKISENRERMIYFQCQICKATIFWNKQINCSKYNSSLIVNKDYHKNEIEILSSNE